MSPSGSMGKIPKEPCPHLALDWSKAIELLAGRQAQTNRPELFRDQALSIPPLVMSNLPSSLQVHRVGSWCIDIQLSLRLTLREIVLPKMLRFKSEHPTRLRRVDATPVRAGYFFY